MFLQLSLTSGDLMKKGNFFATLFNFWRLVGKRKYFYNRLYILEIGQKRVMFLQLSVSAGYYLLTYSLEQSPS
jgi:hypothetical protein